MHLFNLKKSLVSLYICLVALLAVVTFVEHVRGTEFVEKYVYHTVWFCCLWGVLAALAVVVLVKRQLWRHLPALFPNISKAMEEGKDPSFLSWWEP